MKIGEGSSGDPQEIAAIIEALRRAGRGTEARDPDAVAAMFDADAEPMLFDFLAPGVTTVGEIRRNVAQIAADAVGQVENRYPRITVRILADDLAYSLAYGIVKITSDDGTAIDVHMSVTDIWRRTNGRWLAIHEHSSLPVDIASGRAILKQPLD